ncbi:MAG: TIGR03915 family putative DNA repair protein [Lachnospiraceae bacterium]|nr:TIGR03915 family putative DNA repair protein [Lachnospiraceae bacterium]
MRIYLCEDSFEGILTAVYDAWAGRLGHDNVRLELQGEYNLELFADYVVVLPDDEKAEKVVRTLRQKLSEEVFEYVYKAAMSQERRKADLIYRFIVLAIQRGARIVSEFGNPVVMDIFELVRNVSNESHLLLGFIRFQELENGVLFAKITPKNYVLTLIAPHFEDRLSGENWVIYDAVHEMAAVHARNTSWVLSREAKMPEKLPESGQEEEYEELWKIFFHTIGIEARKNPKCQRNMLPLWYRKNMLEFENNENC